MVFGVDLRMKREQKKNIEPKENGMLIVKEVASLTAISAFVLGLAFMVQLV